MFYPAISNHRDTAHRILKINVETTKCEMELTGHLERIRCVDYNSAMQE